MNTNTYTHSQLHVEKKIYNSVKILNQTFVNCDDNIDMDLVFKFYSTRTLYLFNFYYLQTSASWYLLGTLSRQNVPTKCHHSILYTNILGC